MSAPKTPKPIPTISPTFARRLAVGESCIVSASDATAVSAEFSRLKPMTFDQQMVFVVHPRTAACSKMFAITRTA